LVEVTQQLHLSPGDSEFHLLIWNATSARRATQALYAYFYFGSNMSGFIPFKVITSEPIYCPA